MEETTNIRLPWNDWKIVGYLGGGAYGKVYKIERNISGIQEEAAVKIVSRPKDENEIEAFYDNGYDKESIIASYEGEIRNYVQEYKLLKDLQGQSNIVSCDDFTVMPHASGIGADIFIRMELLTPLQQILRDRLLSEKEIIKLGKDIAHALSLCEKKHIVHRDIKPMNVMVSKFGDYKLGDFGVSKIMDHATLATAMGTPEYQAPEVVHMERYGHAADIYSLGIMMYWLLNNRRMPFIGADERITIALKDQAMEKRYRGEKLPMPQNGSAQLKQIVMKACEYKQENRYASAQEMYDALDALERGTFSVNVPTQEKNDATVAGVNAQKTEPAQNIRKITSTASDKRVVSDWGVTEGTVGKPAGSAPNAQKQKILETEKTQPAVAYHELKNKQVPKQGKADVVNKGNDSSSNWIETTLAKIPVEKTTTGNTIIDIVFAVGAWVLAFVTMTSGLIPLTVIFVIFAFIWSNGIGYTDFNCWMKENKKKVNNIDDLIKNHPEFAKRLYYEKCPNKHMLEYIDNKDRNPTVAKEIKASVKK